MESRHKFDFDKLTQRRGTASLKWDVAEGELPMWVADMDFECAPCIKSAVIRRAEHGIYGYNIVPDEWAEAYAGFWKRRHGWEMKREYLTFTTGIVPAISSLVRRLTNIGDSVALFTPVYDIFFHSIENAGRHTLEVPLVYADGEYHIDFADLEEKLKRPLTTLFILCNPHNPCGNVWTAEEIRCIAALCRAHGVAVISDEIHCSLTDVGVEYTPFASVSAEAAEISVTCLSASKAFNIAGMQSAAIYAENEALRNKAVRGVNSDEVAEPNCFAVVATVAALNDGEEWLDEAREYLDANKARVREFISENIPSVRCVKQRCTYLVWIDCSAITSDSDELSEFIRKRTGLMLSSGAQYRGNGRYFLRLNTACPRARLEDGLGRLKSGIEQYIAFKKGN